MKRFVYLMLVAVPLLAVSVYVASGKPSSPTAPIEVGSATGGQNAVEFVGRVDQDGGAFTSYGYLTHISGLTDTLLFTQIFTTNETTARFTYYATATLTSRAVISGVFVIDSVGTTVYYFNPTAGATFTTPLSFAAGVPIMTATVRSQNILNVPAPNLGISTNIGELTQTGVSPFTLNTQTYQLGSVGVMERTWATGEGTRTNAVIPQSFIVLSGNAVVTGVPGQASFLPLVIHNQ
jgi:hypothetical protein